MAVEYSVGGLAIDLKINGYETAMSQINELKKQLKSGNSSDGKSSGGVSNKSIAQWFNIGKLYYFIDMSKQYTRVLSNMLQNAINYNETLNLWQVAMRGNIAVAEEFIGKMSRAYGLSEETLMRYQAVFKNMLSALGDLEDGISTKLSEVMLARAIDFASLYNVTNERAFTVFQAVLSGQVRPIRSISGYDITENTIFDMYQKAGGEKTVRQLSQIEKRLLRIYAIFGQMDTTGATGDWAKQIEEPANQLRILGEQLKELGQWIGQLFLNVLQPVLPQLNAFVMTIKEITKALAIMAGYTKPNHLEGFTESINETDEAIENLTGKLFSFDKFDVAGGGSSSNIFGIDPTVQGLLDSMNTSIKDIAMEATKLSQKWLEMIGIIYNVDTGTYEITERFRELAGIVGAVFKTIGGVLALFIGNKLMTGIISLLSIGSTFKSFSDIIKNFVSPLNIIIGLIGYLYLTNEDFRESINSLFPIIVNLFGYAMKVAKPFLTTIINTFSTLLNTLMPIITCVLDFAVGLIDLLDKLGLLEGIVYLAIGAFVVWKGLQLLDFLSGLSRMIGLVATALKLKLVPALLSAQLGWSTMSDTAKLASLAIGTVLAVTVFSGLNAWFETLEGTTKKWITTLTTLVAVLTTATVAWLAYHGTKSMGIAIPIILTAVGTGIAGVKGMIEAYANGGFPNQGQIFIARESGAEMVGNIGGRTAVANNDQIVESVSGGVREAIQPLVIIGQAIYRTMQSGGNMQINIDGQKLANNLTPRIKGNLAREGVAL